MAKTIWRAYPDASCYPNPGPAGAACVIEKGYGKNKPILTKGSFETTINRAELMAIQLGIEFFVKHDDGKRLYHVYSDSEWSVKALRWKLWSKPDGYPVNKNTDMVDAIFNLSEPIRDRLNVTHIPRLSHVHNRKADEISRVVRLEFTVIDEKKKKRDKDEDG